MKSETDLRNSKGYSHYVQCLSQTTEWLAKEYNVSSCSMRLTCGATGALDAVLALFDRGATIATMPYEYFDIRRLSESRNLKVSSPRQPSSLCRNSLESFIEWLKKTEPEGCYISLPNNPNGQEYSKDQLIDIFHVMKGRIVIIDQALLTSQCIPFEWFNEHGKENILFVVRSFAKSHGLVGERIGMLFSNSEMGNIHQYAHAPSLTSLVSLRRRWRSRYAPKCLRLISQNNQTMTDWAMHRKDLIFQPSTTNFACIHFNTHDAQDVTQYLADCGMLVSSHKSLGSIGNFIRIDMTTRAKSMRLLLSCIDQYLFEHEKAVGVNIS